MYNVIASDGNQYGPVPIDTLMEWALQNRIGPSTLIIDTSTNAVTKAESLPELTVLFAPTLHSPPTISPSPTASPPDVQINNVIVNSPGAVSGMGPPRTMVAALLLAIFLGPFGVHRFYLGHGGTGAAMLLISLFSPCTYFFSLIAVGVWVFIDIVMIATGSLKDAEGRALI